MTGLLKRISITVFALLLSLSVNVQAMAKYASLIMDADTGRVLHSVNADTRNYPASLTKMMTLYLVFGALETKKWTWETRLKVSRRAASQPPSKLGLRPGKTISVRQAVMALVTKSANDVAVTIAENMSKTERRFALKMTAAARKIGMSRTTFRNASGLPNRGQLSTARDMSKLARALIRDYPIYYQVFSVRQFVYGKRVMKNHNTLLTSYEGTDGIKTGYIRAAGYNLVASVKRGDQRLIGVVFGGDSSKQRNLHMTNLLNKAFLKLDQENGSQTVVANASPIQKDVISKSKNWPRNRRWGIQVGAFSSYQFAYDAAKNAKSLLSQTLANAKVRIVNLRKRSGKLLFRARINGVSKRQAYSSCRYLKRRKTNCMELRVKQNEQLAAAR